MAGEGGRVPDEAFGSDWLTATGNVLAMVTGGMEGWSDGPHSQVMRDCELSGLVRTLTAAMARAGSCRWTPQVVALVVGHGAPHDLGLRSGEDWRTAYSRLGTDGAARKALRVGHALASGDAACLARSERAALRERFAEVAADDDRDARVRMAAMVRSACAPGRSDADASVPDRVVALVPWRGVAAGRRTAEVIATTRVTVDLATAPVADAPPVLVLRSLRGHEVTLRRHGDAFLRPVLAPGTWDPVTVAEFVEAAAEGQAWADSPFAAPVGDGTALLSLSDVASEATRESRANDAAREEARVAALARAGRLVVVDGVVHRETPPPTFGPVCVPTTGNGLHGGVSDVAVRMGWWFEDGPSYLEPQGTLMREARRTLHRAYPEEFGPWTCGMADVPAVAELLRDWMAASAPLPEDAKWRPAHDGRPTHEVLDPSAFPDDGHAAARSLAWACRQYGSRDEAKLTGLREVGAAARALTSGEHVDAREFDVRGVAHRATSRVHPVDVAALLRTLSDAVVATLASDHDDLATFVP